MAWMAGSHGLGIVVRRHADEDVDFADVDQLANEIVREYALVCHRPPPDNNCQHQIRRNLNQ